MPKKPITAWTLVQHSGFGYGKKPGFKRAVETRMITGAKEIQRVIEAGGLILNDYSDAEDRADHENYPEGLTGIVPCVQGSFSTHKVDYLAVYIPKPKSVTVVSK